MWRCCSREEAGYRHRQELRTGRAMCRFESNRRGARRLPRKWSVCHQCPATLEAWTWACHGLGGRHRRQTAANLYTYQVPVDLSIYRSIKSSTTLPWWVTGYLGTIGDESFLGRSLFGHMVGGSQPCVDLLRKTIRAIDSRKLLGGHLFR